MALVTNDMTKAATICWDDIDPTVYVDENGQAWLFWGNTAWKAPGALTADAGSFHRSVCINYLFHNNDGTLKRVVMTSRSVPPAK
jgi:hypothetical protein